MAHAQNTALKKKFSNHIYFVDKMCITIKIEQAFWTAPSPPLDSPKSRIK